MIRILAVFLGICSLAVPAVHAQQMISSDGTDFIVCSDFTGTQRTGVAAIGSYTDNVVTVSYFTASGENVFKKFKMTPNSIANVGLIGSFNKLTNTPTHCLYHITAQQPVSVQVYNLQENHTEMYLAIPTKALGSNYIAECWPTSDTIEANRGSVYGLSQFIVMGAFDNTHVSISFDPALPYVLPTSFTINKGEAVLIVDPTRSHSRAHVGSDLSTTTITADQPIAVLSGNSHAESPDMSKIWEDIWDDFKNPMVEQLRPLNDWTSSDYVAIPFFPTTGDITPKTKGADFRAYSATPPATVTRADTAKRDTQSVQQFMFAAFPNEMEAIHFTSAQKMDVMMHAHYQGHSDFSIGTYTIGYGAPMMVNIIPVSEWQNHSIWYVPPWGNGPFAQYINVIAVKSELQSRKLKIYRNGILMDYTGNAVAWYDIPNFPNLRGMTVPVTPANYFATGDSNFIVYSYGRSNGQYKGAAAYGAPCGFLLNDDTWGPVGLAIDTSCGGWSGYVTDSRQAPYTVSDISLDPASVNASLIKLPVDTVGGNSKDTILKFGIVILDSSKDAKALVSLHDFFGSHLRSTLTYTAPHLKVTGYTHLQRIPLNYDTCVSLHLINTGTAPFPLDLLSQDTTKEITFDTTQHLFPVTLAPRDTLNAALCFAPLTSDTSIVDTLIFRAGCVEFHASVSITTMSSHVEWLSSDTMATLLCGAPDTIRFWLANTNPKNVQETITNVGFAGPDAPEFRIVANQLGYTTLANFPLDGGERIWIDVAFTPDLTKPEPARWEDRHASLVASNTLHTDPQIDLTAHLNHPVLSSDRASLDLGDNPLGATGNGSITLTDSGNAPVVVTSISTGDPKITVIGIAVGDTIWPGDVRVVKVSASSNNPDTISTILSIGLVEGCVNPVLVPVTFIAHRTGHIAATAQGIDFPAMFTCTQQTSQAIFTNHSTDSVFVDHAVLVGDASFSFADGSQYQNVSIKLAPDSSIAFDVICSGNASGPTLAIFSVVWDSLGHLVPASSELSATITQATASLAATAPIVFGNSAAKSVIELPIQLQQPPPAALTANSAIVKLRYRRDLFRYKTTLSEYHTVAPVISDEGSGNSIMTLTVNSATGFTSGDLARIQLEVMLAFDSTSPLELVSVKFLGASNDTLCIDVDQHSSVFNAADQCGDKILRDWMLGNSPSFSIEQITPNPSNGIVNVGVSAKRPSDLHIRILNALGEDIKEETRTIQRGTVSLLLDVNAVPNGSYVITFSNGIATQRRRIEIIH